MHASTLPLTLMILLMISLLCYSNQKENTEVLHTKLFETVKSNVNGYVVKDIFEESASCTLEQDCIAANCIGVEGTPPNCVCDCKPGWKGNKCNQSETLPNSTQLGYTSEYFVTCSKADTWQNATKRCQSYGDGWDIATVPGSDANNIIYQLEYSRKVFLGGSDIAQQTVWVWQAGRLKNQSFWSEGQATSLYSNWNIIPDNWNCSNRVEHYLARLDRNRKWYDGFDQDVPGCAIVSKCVACERSPCVSNLDCNSTGVFRTTGYYPNCTCVCFPGYSGEICDKYNVLPNSTQFNYTSEFTVVCHNITSYTSAINACQSFLSGWDIASIPSSDANSVIKSILTKDSWFGGNDINSTGKWKWASGRLNDKYFWNSSSGSTGICNTGMYCSWGSAQPDTSKCGTTDRNVIAIKQSGEWVSAIDKADAQCNNVPICAVCERLPCNIVIDCATSNSMSAYGYFPLCKCDCRPGWQGDKCDQNLTIIPVVNWIGYTSEYFLTCYKADTWQNAVKKCQSFGNGWDIATILTNQGNEAIGRLAWGKDIWLGGNDITQQGSWVWQAGRYKNKTFWKSDTGNILYTNWTPGYPNRYTCDGVIQHYLVREASVWTWDDRFDKYMGKVCNSNVPSCVACERSPCISKDITCNATNTINVTGYFPLCECQCKLGYGGKHCDDRVCVISVDCSNNAMSTNGSYPNCICICKPGWAGADCGTRVCDVQADCYNHASSLSGTYPNCACHCEPGWEGTSCNTRICDIKSDCNASNTVAISGTYPSCLCQCKPGWLGSICDTRVCDVVADCNNNAKAVNGTYPYCHCDCLPLFEPTNCAIPTTTLFPPPTLPTTAPTTTLSPGLPTCPFRGIYPCKRALLFDIQRGDVLWPIQLDLGALLSVGSSIITLPVLKGIPFSNLTENNTELLSKSVTEGGGATDVPYRRENGAFFLNSIGILSDRMYIEFKETSPGFVKKSLKSIPPKLTLRFNSPSLVNDCCNGSTSLKYNLGNILTTTNDALDVGNITIVTLPYGSVDKRGISGDAKATINAIGKFSCKKALLGTSWVELTAAAPLGRLLPIDAPYYVRAIGANVILVIVVTIVHLVVVIIFKKTNPSRTVSICCAKTRFPSVTIGCLFAVSPGTAIAAGGLLGTWSGTAEGCDVYPNDNNTFAHIMALIGVLVIIGTFVFTLVYPKIYISRSLIFVPLLPGVRRSRVELLFPATVVLPYPRADMFHSLIGTIRLPGLVWPSVPMWSSVVLFIFSLIFSSSSSFAIVSLLAGIIHLIIIIAIIATRPFYALSLNIIHCLGVLPVTLLTLIQGILLIQDSAAITGDNTVVILFSHLVSFAVVTRLLLYIVQPLPSFFLLSITPDPSLPTSIWSDISNTNMDVNTTVTLLNRRRESDFLDLNKLIIRPRSDEDSLNSSSRFQQDTEDNLENQTDDEDKDEDDDKNEDEEEDEDENEDENEDKDEDDETV